jgi:5'-deoxy-5'-methylthioadenosine phosphorylase
MPSVACEGQGAGRLGIIGGTGLTSLAGLDIVRREVVNTPYGEPSGPLIHGQYCEREVVFLARHGSRSHIPPHRVNYRANVWAFRQIGVRQVVAVNAVGGIRQGLAPGVLVVPDQVIDYTWGREHTFFEDGLATVVHVDLTDPYCAALRGTLLEAARGAGVPVTDGGTYGATQGPRLETAAEIRRLQRDGCDIVGMTGMPEAGLAREADICYACCAVVANLAAGLGPGPISLAEIELNLKSGMERVRRLLEQALRLSWAAP